MGRKGNYIGGGTIIGPSGTWPTFDPAAPSTEIIPAEKGGRSSRPRRKHKRRGPIARRSKEQRAEDQIKESFVTNDVIPPTIARSLIEKRIQQIRRERFAIAREVRGLARRPLNEGKAVKALEAKVLEDDRFLVRCASQLELSQAPNQWWHSLLEDAAVRHSWLELLPLRAHHLP